MDFNPNDALSLAPPAYEELNIEVYKNVWIGPVDEPDFQRQHDIRLLIRFFGGTVVYDIDKDGHHKGLNCDTGETRYQTTNRDPDCLGVFIWLCEEVRQVVMGGHSVLLYVREDDQHDPESISRAYAFEEAWRIYSHQPRSAAREIRKKDLDKILEHHMSQLEIWKNMMQKDRQEDADRIYNDFRTDLELRGLVECRSAIMERRKAFRENLKTMEPCERKTKMLRKIARSEGLAAAREVDPSYEMRGSFRVGEKDGKNKGRDRGKDKGKGTAEGSSKDEGSSKGGSSKKSSRSKRRHSSSGLGLGDLRSGFDDFLSMFESSTRWCGESSEPCKDCRKCK